MSALILKINPRRPERDKIKIAAEAIKKGGLVVFPTETVYGIGADAFDEKACAKIFRAKGRPSDNPIIVHVSDLRMAKCVAEIPPIYSNIIAAIWPAPITFIMKARNELPKIVTAGLNTVAVRMPSNRVALELIKASGLPIAAPSANISKKPSSTSALHAIKYFGKAVDVIIDSGRSKFGLESTILDLRSFKVLRPGAFTVEEIEKAFGRRPTVTGETRGIDESKAALSPGMKYRHYSPETPLFLFVGEGDELKKILEKADDPFAFLGSKELSGKIGKRTDQKIILGSRKNLKEIAANLFDALIALDSLKVKYAIIESFDEKGYGLAIMNRLRKATQHKAFKTAPELEKLVDEIDKTPAG
jgi:L-threonylcarbamoyladenylate synthase